MRFACGARNGVRMISTPSLWKTSSKLRLNLLSRSWIRNRQVSLGPGVTRRVGM
jgi:hypothetical protein